MYRHNRSRPRVSSLPLSVFLSVLGLGLAPIPVGAKTASEESYQEARVQLDKALVAVGGEEALRSIKTVTRAGRTRQFNHGQSLEPEGTLTSQVVEEAAVADFERGWSAREVAVTYAGSAPQRGLIMFKGDAGFTHSRVRNTLVPMSAGAVAAARTALGRDPARLLLTAAARAETLRSLGEAPLDGRPHRVIAFADSDGTQITLYIDAQTHLVSKQEVLADDPVLGDTTAETLFADYRRVGRVRLPFRITARNAGRVTDDTTYSKVEVDVPWKDRSFQLQRGVVHLNPSPPPKATVTELGNGVYFVGGSHNSLFVEFKDHVLLVEAPASSDWTETVLAKIRETVGDKPLRYVVPTHYHFDHIGGLRAAIAAGATVVTTRGNRALVHRLAAARHTLRPDALSRRPRDPSIEIVSGKRVFTDGHRSIEIHDVGPTPHVKEMLIAYVPEERVVFVADLFHIAAEGPLAPVGVSTRQFAETLKKLRLRVDRIAPGHGRLGSMKDLNESLRKPVPVLPAVAPIGG